MDGTHWHSVYSLQTELQSVTEQNRTSDQRYPKWPVIHSTWQLVHSFGKMTRLPMTEPAQCGVSPVVKVPMRRWPLLVCPRRALPLPVGACTSFLGILLPCKGLWDATLFSEMSVHHLRNLCRSFESLLVSRKNKPRKDLFITSKICHFHYPSPPGMTHCHSFFQQICSMCLL